MRRPILLAAILGDVEATAEGGALDDSSMGEEQRGRDGMGAAAAMGARRYQAHEQEAFLPEQLSSSPVDTKPLPSSRIPTLLLRAVRLTRVSAASLPFFTGAGTSASSRRPTLSKSLAHATTGLGREDTLSETSLWNGRLVLRGSALLA